jgi:hypothetical protein
MAGMFPQQPQRSVSDQAGSALSLEQWRRDLSNPSILYTFGANAMIDLPQSAPTWTLQIVHHDSNASGTSQKSSNDGLPQPVTHPLVQRDALLYPSTDYLSLRQVQHERWTAAHAQTDVNVTSDNTIQSIVDNQGEVGWDNGDALEEQDRHRTVASLNGNGTVQRAAAAANAADATTIPMHLARSNALRNAEWEREQPRGGVGPSHGVEKDNADAVAYPLLYSSSDEDNGSGTDSKKLARRDRRRKQKRRKAKRKKKSRGDSDHDQFDKQSNSHALDQRGSDDDDDTVSIESEIARRRRRRRRKREKRRQKRKRYKYRDDATALEDDDATVDSVPFAQDRKRQNRRTSPIQSMTTDSVDWSSDSSTNTTKGGRGDGSDHGGSNGLSDKRKLRRIDPHATTERDDRHEARNGDKGAKHSGRKHSLT